MKNRIIILVIGLVIGLSQIAFASFSGTPISLNGNYGASWDHSELWSVLSSAGYTALAQDVYNDVSGLGTSGSYGVYKDTLWQAAHGYSAEIIAEVAGYKNNNRFGWYDGQLSTEIFSGPDSISASANFNNANSLGFWIDANGSGNYYYTNTADNLNDNLQAIVFDLSGYSQFGSQYYGYLICFEDLSLSGNNDTDYQDMIVHLNPASPEPASVSLLGLGLLGIGLLRGKRDNKINKTKEVK
ncbi:MAG: PEP-CTERM sorting domain-containing protein [Candidatus Omnitrophota bacterium]